MFVCLKLETEIDFPSVAYVDFRVPVRPETLAYHAMASNRTIICV